jgi:hypothetical protein
MGLLILVAGCHGGDATVLERISRGGHSKIAAVKPGELAEKGKAAIVTDARSNPTRPPARG